MTNYISVSHWGMFPEEINLLDSINFITSLHYSTLDHKVEIMSQEEYEMCMEKCLETRFERE